MHPLNEDDLVLHYYGEMPAGDERAGRGAPARVRACQASYTKLQRVMASVDSGAGAGARRRLRANGVGAPRAGARPSAARLARRGSCSPRRGSPGPPAVVVLVVGAFFAGRAVAAGRPARGRRPRPPADSARADPARRSRRAPRSIADDAGGARERGRRRRASTSRRSARAPSSWCGQPAVSADRGGDRRRGAGAVLDELERVLVELAASPDAMLGRGPRRVRRRIECRGPALQGARACRRRCASGRRTGDSERTAKSSLASASPDDQASRRDRRDYEETGYRIMNIRQSRVCSIVFAGTLILAGSAAGAARRRRRDTRRRFRPAKHPRNGCRSCRPWTPSSTRSRD